MSAYPIKSPRKLIEVALPLDAINVAAARYNHASTDDTTEGPFYRSTPFTKEPNRGISSINYDLGELLSRATS